VKKRRSDTTRHFRISIKKSKNTTLAFPEWVWSLQNERGSGPKRRPRGIWRGDHLAVGGKTNPRTRNPTSNERVPWRKEGRMGCAKARKQKILSLPEKRPGKRQKKGHGIRRKGAGRDRGE